MQKHKIMFLSFVLAVSVVLLPGCTKSNIRNDLTFAQMMKYAEDMYGESFDVISFVKAKDYTYTDILTLAKGEDFVFNVFHYPEDETFEKIEDDYIQGLLNMKFKKHLESAEIIDGKDFGIYASFKYDSGLTKEMVEKSSVEDLMKQFSVFHIVCVVRCESTEDGYALSEAYGLYNKILEFGAPELNFEVVCVDGSEDEVLSRCISNIACNYENDWTIYPSVNGYISVMDTTALEEKDFLDLYMDVK